MNVCDGKRLGKVSDLLFSFPEGKVQGIMVPGAKGFRWGKGDLYIGLHDVVKIGEDVVLVNLKDTVKCEPKKNKWEEGTRTPCPPPVYRSPQRDRRDYGEYE